MPPEKLNGFDTTYFISTYVQVNKSQPISELNLVKLGNSNEVTESSQFLPFDGLYKYNIMNLEPYKQYYVTIKACNKDLTLDLYYCLNGNLIIFILYTKMP